MKIFISILLLIFPFGKLIDYDLGLPEIQAVCKVTLNDGEIIEGFITFGPGGYDYKYRRHGFCRIRENGEKEIIPYSFPFNLSSYYRFGNNQTGNKKLYYAENITGGRVYGKNKKKEFNEEQKTLTITKTDVEKYRLLEQMTIYKKLPLDLFVRYSSDEQNGKTTIEVSQIKSVELMKKPSNKSLEIIKNIRKKQGEMNEEWVDYQPPIWFHEIITNQEKINYLSKYF